ncbi:MAG: ABC transporter permease, partial [Proteobacteria bacterium]|nr:ABC transporter permease [Pseudomonadota bacterium]
MLAFIIKRLLLAALIVVIAVVLMFIMVHAVPGDPVSVMLGPRASVELKAHLTERMGLNEPLFWQIILFFRGLLNGDMGVDVFSNRQVADIVFEQLPYTLELIFASIIWSALLGISLGVYAAARRGSLIDKITAVLSVGCVAAPAFVVALLLLLFFSVYLQWFPAIG